MKTVKITDENCLSADAPNGFLGEWAAIPDCVDAEGAILICRKHDPNTLKIGGVEIKAFHDEEPSEAIREAEGEGLGENLSDWIC
jgi:hypothetical protein